MSAKPPAEGAESLTRDYFDAVYRAHDDPWGFETSAFEAQKYRATLQALGPRYFARAFEIGCSIGVLTDRLAPRCGRLLAVDVSEAPLRRARQRCAGWPQVHLQRMAVPDRFPPGRFDLVLMSEVGYYWSAQALAQAAQQTLAALQPGGLWLLVHWTPWVPDYPQTGDGVHDFVLRFARDHPELRHLLSRREPQYRLDLLQCAAPAQG